MTAYKLSGQFICSSQIMATHVAEGKRRRREVLEQVKRRRGENYKRFLEKQRKIALQSNNL
jgi:hypothetical protein